MPSIRQAMFQIVRLVVMTSAVLMSGAWAGPPSTSRQFETEHYAITTYASAAHTRRIGDAVESLHEAYAGLFPSIAARPTAAKLLLTLYRDREQFRQASQGSDWAEAYYQPPRCFAYFAATDANPYHWMVHEAVHQLNHEVARIPAGRWINEGLATYFGSSVIINGKLKPGVPDVDAYPIWSVARLRLSGDLQRDIKRGRIIALRSLIAGKPGLEADANVNARYIGYWSLTHFLFHFENGRFASRFRQLIGAGGSVDNFERLVGPVEQVQDAWYRHLQEQVRLTGKFTSTSRAQNSD